MLAAPAASAQNVKPRVPPGADPGGVAVAFIGPGIDYTRPEIARRLARDGEGEIIGWDYLDNDRRPYERCDWNLAPAESTCASLRGLTILQESTARLIVVRAWAERPQSLVQAIRFVAQSPAKIVLLSTGALDPQFVKEAAQRFPALLIVVGATTARERGGDNVIVAAAAVGPASDAQADLTLPTGHPTAQRHEIAAARVTALVARLLAQESRLDAAELKRRLLALATPTPAATNPGSNGGQVDPAKPSLPRPR